MFKENKITGEFYEKMVNDSLKITEAVDIDFEKSIEELESEFRKILGVI